MNLHSMHLIPPDLPPSCLLRGQLRDLKGGIEGTLTGDLGGGGGGGGRLGEPGSPTPQIKETLTARSSAAWRTRRVAQCAF